MIYIGHGKNKNFVIGIRFIRSMKFIVKDSGKWKKLIPHYFIEVCYGRSRFWFGFNRIKRIVKGKLYKLDGVVYRTK